MSMAIADTDTRKGDADETSTGGSKNILQNEAKKMLSCPGSSQLGLPGDRSYFKINDFAFYMPGGWDNITLNIFIDCCKKYMGDVRHSCKDELKLGEWEKIVKMCEERSNFHSKFKVNSVMELAQSLKGYILKNENRKDDKDFMVLYHDVVELLPYFPSETSDSVSQNLRQRNRSRSTEVKTFASATETAAATWRSPSSFDTLIIKCCEDNANLLNQKSSKFLWNKISQKINENNGIKIDVRKHVSTFKRNVLKEIKKELDSLKRESLFLELVGDYRAIFDYIPPCTVRIQDFMSDNVNITNGNHRDGESNDKTSVEEMDTSDESPLATNQHTDTEDNEAALQKGNRNMSKGKSVSLKKIEVTSDTLKLDAVNIKNKTLVKRNSGTVSTESAESVNNSSRLISLRSSARISKTMVRYIEKSPKKEVPVQITASDNGEPAPKKQRGRPRKVKLKLPENQIIDGKLTNELHKQKSINFGRRRVMSHSENSKDSSDNPSPNSVSDEYHSVSSRIKTCNTATVSHKRKRYSTHLDSVRSVESNDSSESEKSEVRGSGILPNRQHSSSDPNFGVTLRRVETKKCVPIQPSVTSSASCAQVYPNQPLTELPNNHGIVASVEPCCSYSNTVQVAKEPSVNLCGRDINHMIVPHNSNAPETSQNSRTCDINERVHEGLAKVHRLDASSRRMIEGYKEKVKESSPFQSMTEIIPTSQVMAVSSGSINSRLEPENAISHLMNLGNSRPPSWFDNFFCDYKKLEMWKMRQLVKMQEELVDMESKKLSVLENILHTFQDKKK